VGRPAPGQKRGILADLTLYIRDAKTGVVTPIKVTDNGDGTYTAGAMAIANMVDSEVSDG